MEKLYTQDKKNFLVYHKEETLKNKAPYVIFLHGLMSNMNGAKALATQEHCIIKGYNFIRFDNFGHGSSSGEFTDFTISDWIEGVNMIISQLTTGPVVLVGSSMGAWLAILATIKYSSKIIGIVTLAAALDFTEKLIWDNLTDDKKQEMKEKGILQVGSDNCEDGFPITYNLILDAKKYLLLDSPIDISCPICLIHGMKDSDASYKISLKTSEMVKSQHVIVKLIKDGEHLLSRKEDLLVLYNSLDEIYSRTFNK